MPARLRPLRSCPLLLLLGLALGCGGGGGLPPPGGVGTGSLAGTLLLAEPGVGVVLEAEPNDAADSAHVLGTLRPGQSLVVHGHISSAAGADPFDGFQLLAPERVRVTATLAYSAAGGTDLDLGVFDLLSFQFVETFLSTSAPEIGTFHAQGAFDLVVEAYAGAGDYVLTIVAVAAGDPVGEREPNGTFAETQALGELVEGQTLTWAGQADAASDRVEVASVGFPAASRLSLSLAFPAGADFDVEVHDATLNLAAPSLLSAFESPSANPETGAVPIRAGSLITLRVIAYAGSGPWRLTLGAGPAASSTARAFVGEARGVAPRHLEAARRKPGAGATAFGRLTRELVPGEALVGWRRGAPAGDGGALRLRASRPHPDDVRAGGDGSGAGVARLEVDVPLGADPEERARATLARVAALASLPDVAYAEVNGVRRATAVPDDPYYNLQWGYPLLRLPEAWNLSTGSAAVVVAILDTGRTAHPDLAANQVGGYDMISSATRARDGDGRDPDPTDVGDREGGGGASSFHGTHVAGTLGAVSGNGIGVAGVCWSVRLMHVRVLGQGGGSDADIADGIRYAAGLPNASGALPAQRAQVINLSLGGAGFSQTMQDAVTAARAAGVVVFAATGNENSGGLFSPAGLAGVIGVGAVDAQRVRAPYSNYGSAVDLACPGGDVSVDRTGDGYGDGVLSTLYDDTVSPPRATYAFYQGTSMACPHAAGVAALMLSVAPGLTPDQVESLLRAHAVDLGAPGRDDLYGSGLVDAYRSVLAAQGGGGTGAPRLVVSPTALDLGTTETTADVLVANGGGGLLTVGDPQVDTAGGGPWLSASLVGPGDGTRTAAAVRVRVSRAGLAEGAYAGRVTVPSDGGSADVQVLLRVGAGAQAPDLTLYVLAVDPATGETVAEARVEAARGLAYELAGLAPGRYLLFAGTDLDGDGWICDAGEWCGAWPVLGAAQEVEVRADGRVTALDFVVGPDLRLAGASAGGGPSDAHAEGAPGPGARRRAACLTR